MLLREKRNYTVIINNEFFDIVFNKKSRLRLTLWITLIFSLLEYLRAPSLFLISERQYFKTPSLILFLILANKSPIHYKAFNRLGGKRKSL